jgi:methylglutaconyl-CoA hydratase
MYIVAKQFIGGTQRLTRCVGISRAKELIFTGQMIDGNTAQLYSLVNCCVQQNEHGDAAYQKALSMGRIILKNVRFW